MILLLLLTALFAPCNYISAASSFIVEIDSQDALIPINILFQTEGSAEDLLSDLYLKTLVDTLTFDLEHNGVTTTKSSSPMTADQITLIFKDDTISLLTKEFKTEPLDLKFDMEKDRKQIHLLADTYLQTKHKQKGFARSHILYTKRQENPQTGEATSELWECDYDGKNGRRIYVFDNYCVTPTYMPPPHGSERSKSALFVGYKTGQPKIYQVPLTQGKIERVSYLPGNQLMPTVNKQGNQIAFVSDATGNPDLFIQKMPLSEKPAQIYTKPYATQGSPSFSPDGSQVAFVSNQEGSPQIYLLMIPTAGSPLKNIHAKRLTRFQRECTAPCFSHDGHKIAYCAKTDNVRQIFIYDLLKNEEKQLTFEEGDKENPHFSPNDNIIVYNKREGSSSDLYLLNVKNQVNTKITSGYGDKRFPSWEPCK